jgi:transcriptional regulator with PAS, ATPase and Fis domain
VHADFRVVATTNDDLEALVADSEFRADLYYRLNEIELELPPLRDRKCDIPLLAENFMREQCRRLGSDYRPLEGETLRLLQDYDWPGNVRELQNVIKRGVILGQFRPRRHARSNGNGAKERSAAEPAPRSLEEASELAEKRALVRALEMTDGHRGHAAEELGVSYRTLLRRMKKYDIHFTPEPVG